MKKITFFLLALATSGSLVSCGDDKKSEDPKPKTKSELLMAKAWTVTAETETTGAKTKDVFAENYDACELDDAAKFLAGNILNLDQGKIKCDKDEPGSVVGSWALSENDTKLSIVVFGFGSDNKVEELTENKMVLSQAETVNGQTTTTKTTFSGK